MEILKVSKIRFFCNANVNPEVVIFLYGLDVANFNDTVSLNVNVHP